ncbi:hypothetical protein ACHWQZ_G016038 [Mnemiopsis leidyi]
MRLLVSTLLLIALAETDPVPFSTTTNFVEYYPGDPDSNVVLTSPHDGHVRHEDVPDRIRGCYNETDGTCDWRHDCEGQRVSRKCSVVTWADRDSSVLALKMRQAIGRVLGVMPHLIVSRMHRSKLDPNRDRENAAQFNPVAELTYDTFHDKIQEVHDQFDRPAIHFDIHGYTSHNTDNWLELGYNIRGSDLNKGLLDPEVSSLKALAARSDKPFPSIIAGDDSLGKLVMDEGYRVVPSPQYPRPDTGIEGRYFRGGYITRKWGSLYGGDVDCVQLEVPQWVRDESDVHGERLGRAFAQWVKDHY